MLDGLHFGKDEELVKYARQICRWHHERWDGRGYPDGLKGSEIPIAAQAVALADVYDALVSERVYKKAYSHETAVSMIENGECGMFNPDLMQCFRAEADSLNEIIFIRSDPAKVLFDADKLSREVLERSEPGLSGRTVLLLERERAKFTFAASFSDGLLFDYDSESDTVAFSGKDRERFGYPKIIADSAASLMGEESPEALAVLQQRIASTSPGDPVTNACVELTLADGIRRACEVTCLVVWAEDGEEPRRLGVVGRVAVRESCA